VGLRARVQCVLLQGRVTRTTNSLGPSRFVNSVWNNLWPTRDPQRGHRTPGRGLRCLSQRRPAWSRHYGTDSKLDALPRSPCRNFLITQRPFTPRRPQVLQLLISCDFQLDFSFVSISYTLSTQPGHPSVGRRCEQ